MTWNLSLVHRHDIAMQVAREGLPDRQESEGTDIEALGPTLATDGEPFASRSACAGRWALLPNNTQRPLKEEWHAIS
jgi:hypothetical protein